MWLRGQGARWGQQEGGSDDDDVRAAKTSDWWGIAVVHGQMAPNRAFTTGQGGPKSANSGFSDGYLERGVEDALAQICRAK